MSEQTSVDPWVVQPPKVSFTPLPVGFYLATFKAVEEVKLQDNSVKWRFSWEVATGDHKGKVASALTDRSISTNTLPGVLISRLLGRSLVADEHVKNAIDACKGKNYMVSIQPGPKGGKPCVRMVSQPPQI